VVAFPALAFADTASDISPLLASVTSEGVPVVLAIATGLIGLALLRWGVSAVYGAIHARRTRV
jgi:short subunit fatty acids transporter